MAGELTEVVAGRIHSRLMFALLVILVFVYNLSAGIYRAGGMEPSAALEFVYSAAFLCGVFWWLRADAGRNSAWPLYCPGVLLQAGWIVIIPYDLLKTRGAKGLLPLLALIGSFVAANILAALLFVILSTES